MARKKVTLYWVPGHIGVERNEKADELARKVASTPFMGPEIFCGIGANTIRGVLRDNERECWARHWAEQPGKGNPKP